MWSTLVVVITMRPPLRSETTWKPVGLATNCVRWSGGGTYKTRHFCLSCSREAIRWRFDNSQRRVSNRLNGEPSQRTPPWHWTTNIMTTRRQRMVDEITSLSFS
ncbi:hypothetical protein Cob_v003266 [Colletotrichum orbiculare MAFF 240422]|uniref:Uncharacterized protein n=1 Tax=Colletotrichum orbiculare (strain 104-T / ATCC 96160 / CBS 514.97 / LARS 414 / MAFF 240422) TaxID=1213857 RepID=A0A484G258_COLOR|nr:hypothetical protein Cob_v003266 [Colletotrichum orbiculare MAFF 240422]